MASSSALASPSSPSSHGDVGEKMLPSSSNSSSDEKAARALEALMWPHNLDSTRYGLPEGYILLAPEPGQRAYDPIPKGFALTPDALEARLRFPLHPIISSCISWWRISPS
ncbi:hypothetical protein C4D60_Mb09t18520 [Musa balbisiana]|uniref:Uncharacterized protein n=1 Tax=Musa balbisiana TaxID=52838 RepID=A0A4S8IHF2_MUSBA|nr:hypothetical protein C4D60_Mb09t18520 [Musa balbisiana]